jgi:uncharacterized membrane protein
MTGLALPGGVDWIHVRSAAGLLIALAMAIRGYGRKSLSASGALAAVAVGFTTLAVSWRFGSTLIAFYVSSSALTRVGTKQKAAMERGHVDGGQRDAWQVFINAGIGSTLCVVHALAIGVESGDVGPVDTAVTGVEALPVLRIVRQGIVWLLNAMARANWHQVSQPVSEADVSLALRAALLCGIVGSFGCACGDTWASEIGILSKSRPRLVTSCCLRPVAPGTNGGISVLGTVASAGGGLFIGLVAASIGFLTGVEPAWILLAAVGTVSGFLGSMIDSVLGATLQETVFVSSGDTTGGKEGQIVALDPSEEELMRARLAGRTMGTPLLSNNMVNLASIACTTLLSMVMGAVWCFTSLPI